MAHAYKNSKTDLTTTNATDIVTVPTKKTDIVKSILVSDDSGSGDTFDLTIVNGSDTYSVCKSKSVGANGTSEVLSSPLVLVNPDILKITATTANRLHVIVSYLEVS
tara:strand:- start:972 stop:1292 length:321 start_codon:yes stop_codon:yes gene_type:complete